MATVNTVIKSRKYRLTSKGIEQARKGKWGFLSVAPGGTSHTSAGRTIRYMLRNPRATYTVNQLYQHGGYFGLGIEGYYKNVIRWLTRAPAWIKKVA